MPNDLITQAARNNALWCDAVCATHDGAGAFHNDLWINRNGVPRFYPDVVTLTEAASAQMATISALCETSPQKAWAVKDSFQSLDLAPLGFVPLFDAQWIWAPPEAPRAAAENPRWRRVGDETGLRTWEQCWSDEPVLEKTRIFRPLLLADPDIHFLIAVDEGATVGGGILNRGAGVVGVSNVFAAGADVTAVWEGLARSARSVFPGLPIVAYENDEDTLAAGRNAGFAQVGPLRIWSRPSG